ncbi:28514_t:CDS:2, partial [Dentiscutata erythropus]
EVNVQGGMHDILVSKYYKHIGAIVEQYSSQVMDLRVNVWKIELGEIVVGSTVESFDKMASFLSPMWSA